MEAVNAFAVCCLLGVVIVAAVAVKCPRFRRALQRPVTVFVAFVLLVIAVVLYVDLKSQQSRRVLCERINRTNAGIRGYLATTYPPVNDPRLTPAQRDQLRVRLAYGEAVFADANCTDVVNGKAPPPLPPPPVTPN